MSYWDEVTRSLATRTWGILAMPDINPRLGWSTSLHHLDVVGNSMVPQSPRREVDSVDIDLPLQAGRTGGIAIQKEVTFHKNSRFFVKYTSLQTVFSWLVFCTCDMPYQFGCVVPRQDSNTCRAKAGKTRENWKISSGAFCAKTYETVKQTVCCFACWPECSFCLGRLSLEHLLEKAVLPGARAFVCTAGAYCTCRST